VGKLVYLTITRLFFFSSGRRHTRFSRDWSSDVCSSDLLVHHRLRRLAPPMQLHLPVPGPSRRIPHLSLKRHADDVENGVLPCREIGRASCRERVDGKLVDVTIKRTDIRSAMTQLSQHMQ